MPVINAYQETRRTIWDRLGFGFRRSAELLDWKVTAPKPSDWFVPGVLTTGTWIKLDWRDRLRLLLSGTLLVETYTRTDVEVRRCESRNAIGIMAPKGDGR